VRGVRTSERGDVFAEEVGKSTSSVEVKPLQNLSEEGLLAGKPKFLNLGQSSLSDVGTNRES